MKKAGIDKKYEKNPVKTRGLKHEQHPRLKWRAQTRIQKFLKKD